MEEGMRLREKYSDLICVVISVHETHSLVQFEETKLQYIISERNYNFFEEI